MQVDFEEKALEIYDKAARTLPATDMPTGRDYWLRRQRDAFEDELRRARSMGELNEDDGR